MDICNAPGGSGWAPGQRAFVKKVTPAPRYCQVLGAGVTSRGRRYFQRRQAATGVRASPHGDMVGHVGPQSNAIRAFLQKSKDPALHGESAAGGAPTSDGSRMDAAIYSPGTSPGLYLRWDRRSVDYRGGVTCGDGGP